MLLFSIVLKTIERINEIAMFILRFCFIINQNLTIINYTMRLQYE